MNPDNFNNVSWLRQEYTCTNLTLSGSNLLIASQWKTWCWYSLPKILVNTVTPFPVWEIIATLLLGNLQCFFQGPESSIFLHLSFHLSTKDLEVVGLQHEYSKAAEYLTLNLHLGQKYRNHLNQGLHWYMNYFQARKNKTDVERRQTLGCLRSINPNMIKHFIKQSPLLFFKSYMLPYTK